MKLKRIIKKINNGIIGGVVGFGIGSMLPIIAGTAGGYFLVKRKIYASNQNINNIIALLHATVGLSVGCFVQGVMIITLPGTVLLLTSGVGCSIIGVILMTDG